MILAGDIGGTKTILGLFEAAADGLRLLRSATFVSAEQATFEDVLERFLDGQAGAIDVACFGAAGAVIDGRVLTTNLHWSLEEGALTRHLGAARVKLLNDLEAAAYAVPFMDEAQLVEIQPGSLPRRQGNRAVIAAGTGLGEALLFWDGERFHPIASEGGHADFGPRTDEEIDLLRFLRAELGGHVSYERILSGPGVFNVYRFLRQAGFAPEPEALRQRLASGDPSAAIADAALAGNDPLCVRTMDLFCEIYGAEAANLAVKCLPFGGVYVTGGIAPKILPILRNGSFLRGYLDKGRFRPLLESIPVYVVTNPEAPLLGAAHYALRL